MSWEQCKEAIELYTGLSRDALHIHGAVLLHLFIAAATRRNLGHPIPWLVILVAEILNERSDMFADGISETWEHTAAIHDLWNTMLLPTLLFLISRYAPGLVWRDTRFKARAPEEMIPE